MIDLSKLSPGDLIRLAVHDMKATIRQGAIIDMETYGKYFEYGPCYVCFAGAVMLQREEDECKDFDHYGTCRAILNPDNSKHVRQYEALDAIRLFDYLLFFHLMGINPRIYEGLLDECFKIYTKFNPYERGKEKEFYDQMEGIAEVFDKYIKP